jgi:putative DNA methylase
MAPKNDELVADPYRFEGDRNKAKDFFEVGLKKTFANFYQRHSSDFPVTIFYAFKQKDIEGSAKDKQASTGWETMLSALIDSGFTITGTWPIKTEQASRLRANASNALASSIVLVCRKRPEDAGPCSRSYFLKSLRVELKSALEDLRAANIAPVDLAQSAIGPGMAVFSRYDCVMESDGSPLSVRTALQLINEELDKTLTELEGFLDGGSRLCLSLFSQFGFEKFKYGEADVLARAKNTTIDGLKDKKVVSAEKGSVRLLGLAEIPTKINPEEDNAWLTTHQLTQALKKKGVEGCAEIIVALKESDTVGKVKDLAYLLFGVCERKNWIQEAFDYNSLIQAWPEIQSAVIRKNSEDREPKERTLF